ncbi:hypothetical protein EsH8_V_001141 [Colletotrichum jinshuiense]
MERSGRLLDISQDLSGSEKHRPRSTSSTSTASSSKSTASDSSSVDSLESPESLFAKLVAAAADELDFSDISAAADHYGIPSESSDAIGVGNLFLRDVIGVGTGLTAKVIQHDTGVAAPSGVPKSTIVALKVFNDVESGMQARQDVYRCILREMDAFCDPRLRGHPNIVQLLFVSWHPDEQYPMLAMELGSYGSLEHILCSPDAVQPSQTQKRHMTMDMALGLQAIHGAQLVHGDIKPANMIVFEHSCPGRELIVKMTDFGGSGVVSGAQPAHFTPLWCAPEILAKSTSVDWEKADVYSLALVLASLWDRQTTQDPLPQSEDTSNASVLRNCLPKCTEALKDELDIMTRLKHLPATEDGSVGDLLVRRLERLRDELGVDFEPLVETLLLATNVSPKVRPYVDELVVNLVPLIASLERDTGQ